MAYNAATRTFDTYADLKGQRGTSGTRVNVLGNISISDGGEGEFYWDATSNAVEDGGTIFSPTVGSGSGRWIRNFSGAYNCGWFGIKDDGVTDNKTIFQKIFDLVGNLGGGEIFIPDGTYLIQPTSTTPHCIFARANTSVTFSQDAILKIGANNLTGYSGIRVESVSNVKIYGANVVGDRPIHIGTTGESGMCLSILNSKNIVIDNANLSDAWGDGIYVGGGAGLESENIFISNVYANLCRRQGISIVSCKGASLNNITCANTTGITGAGAGIDLEPNTGTVVENVSLTNIHCYGCFGSGIVSSAANIACANIHCYNNGERGIYISSDAPHLFSDVFVHDNVGIGLYIPFANKIVISNLVSYNNGQDGVRINSSNEDIKISGGVIYNNLTGIVVSGGQLKNYYISGLTIRNNTNGGITAGSPHGIISGCQIYANGTFGLLIGGDYVSVAGGCEIYDNGQTGIQLSANYGRVVGNNIHSNGTAADNTYDNIALTLNASYNNIINNQIKVGINANKPRYGIRVNSATNASNVITVNDRSGGGLTADLQDGGTGTITLLDAPTLNQVLTAGSSSTLNATVGALIAQTGLSSRVVASGNWLNFQTDTGVSNWIWIRSTNDLTLNRRNATTGASIDNVLRIYSATGNIRFGNTSGDPGVKLAIEGAFSVSGSTRSVGTGTPEGVVTGSQGYEFTRTDGGIGLTKYLKESGAGNTGWYAIQTASQKAVANGLATLDADVALPASQNGKFTIRSVTGTATMLVGDWGLLVNNNANCTITLQSAATSINRTYWVKKVSNNAATVTITGAEQGADVVLSALNDAVFIQSNGISYYIISKSVIASIPTLNQVLTAGNTSSQSMSVGNFTSTGSLTLNQNTITSTTTLNDSQTTVWANNVGAITVNLPTAVGRAGRVFIIKKVSANSDTVTVDPAGAETIDGQTTAALSIQYDFLVIQSDGANWYQISPAI